MYSFKMTATFSHVFTPMDKDGKAHFISFR